MQQTRISFHLGAHCTDENRLVKSLRNNEKILRSEGVIVPPPGQYRPLIREVVERLRGEPANEETQDVLFEQILGSEDADRIVLSNEYFMSNDPGAMKHGRLYPGAKEQTAALRNLFPDNPVEFFFALRNPATFVPAVFNRLTGRAFPNYIAGIDPDTLVWSDVIRDMREANPDVPITVWCNEDTPLIWPEVLHEVAGLDPQVRLKGGLDILRSIIASEGIKRLRAYMSEHQIVNEIQRRRVLSAFLDKYALDEAVEEEIDLPGWTPELVEHLTHVYDDDVIEIGRIPGVTVLTA